MSIISSARITYENIYNQSYANIFNLINNRSNVPNPNDSSGSRKFIYQREPRVSGKNFAGFPFIIIPNTDISRSSGTFSKKKRIGYSFEIMVYTVDKTSDTKGDPSGAEQNNTISGNIFKTLNDSTNRKTFRNYGFYNFEITDSPAEPDELEGQPVFIRTFTVEFNQMLRVSA